MSALDNVALPESLDCLRSRSALAGGKPSIQDGSDMDAASNRIAVSYGDICELEVDAIVNPAHADLLGGGGLDGLIHDIAGPELLAACRPLGGCRVGDAKATPGFRLPSQWVIHTVGPIWRGGGEGEDELLASCYRASLNEAVRVGARTVAFPGISTGLHRFPVSRAATIAVREVTRFVAESSQPDQVTFVCFDHTSWRAYTSLIGETS